MHCAVSSMKGCTNSKQSAPTSALANSLVSLPAIILLVLIFIPFGSFGLGFPLVFPAVWPLANFVSPPGAEPVPCPNTGIACSTLSLAQTSLAEAAGKERCNRGPEEPLLQIPVVTAEVKEPNVYDLCMGLL